MKRVLFVCTGNICRSPMAALLFEHEAHQHGESDFWIVESAGTWALEGQPTTNYALEMMARRGLELGGHRAHMITRSDMHHADVIVVMTENHRQALAAEFPRQREKIHLLTEVEGGRHDIADPYGGQLNEYEACANELERLVHLGYETIKAWSK